MYKNIYNIEIYKLYKIYKCIKYVLQEWCLEVFLFYVFFVDVLGIPPHPRRQCQSSLPENKYGKTIF